jgi:hypothetical protein
MAKKNKESNDSNSEVKLSKIQVEPLMLLSVRSGETSYHNHDFTPATEIIKWQKRIKNQMILIPK